MRYKTYRYNTRTCQYERVTVNAGRVIWYCLGVTVMASCMLAGIMLLHDLLVNTDNESRLRKENRALERHHGILSAGLNERQPVLISLENKDRVLHEKIFGAPPALLPAEKVDRASKEALLLADPTTFAARVSSLKATADNLTRQSAATNRYFGNKLKIDEEMLGRINAMPTLQPIAQWEADRLISGFGLRLNPFHKGLYEHPGVDIAMPRGTAVRATASGTVVQLKRSDLQAGYGNYIDIDHGQGIVTRYAHLEDIAVRYGAKIKKGEVIGAVGSSGGSIAPHLHYEILRDGVNVDPINYMVEGLSSEAHDQLTRISHQQNQSLD